MESSRYNLFVRLHKWAWRQDENYLTESLAFVLEHLLEHEPEAAVRLVASMTGGFIQLRPEEAKTLELRTQIVSGEGMPDLELRTARQLAVIEVKSKSELGTGQLACYRKILTDSGYTETRLVLLTRYPPTIPVGEEEPDVYVRWYQIAEWIDQERQRYPFRAVSAFLVEQFLGLLGVKNMVMGQVSWELAGGVRALSSLVNMLYEAATACGLKARVSGGRDWAGITIDRGNLWAGIYYSEPESLHFETYQAKVDPARAQTLAIGEVGEDKDGYWWSRRLNLESEEVHFFARSKASQLQFLEAFLRESYDSVRPVLIAGVDGDEDSEDAAGGD